MTVDCKHSNALLLDLAYGELSPGVGAEVRAHVAQCAQCAGALARVESGLQIAQRLPLENPPSSLSERLMRAASAKAKEHEQAHAAAAVTPWHALAEWLRRVPMVRQVQMAIVMLLMLGVGLWSVPQLSRKPAATGETVVGPDHDGEAGPSAALQPAKPLDLAVDPYTRRIRAKGAAREEGRVARQEAAKPAAVPAEAEAPAEIGNNDLAAAAAKRTDELAYADKTLPALDDHAAAGPEAFAKAAPPAAARARGPSAQFAPPPPMATSSRKLSEKKVTASDLVMNPYARSEHSLGGLGSNRGAGDVASGAAAAAASGGARPNSPQPTSSAQALYAQALERYRAADYTSASTLFEALLSRKDTSEQRTGALLYQARSQRALGRCDLAVTRYETLVARYPASSEAGSALSEGATCYDQLGQTAKGTALLQRGVSTPGLAERARVALEARTANMKPAAAATSDVQ